MSKHIFESIKDVCMMEAINDYFLSLPNVCHCLNYSLGTQGFHECSRRSTGLIALLFFSCCAMLSAYHDWNFLLRKSLTGLFMLKSNGCSLSVQFGETSTTITLFVSIKSRKDSIICHLKWSKMAKAGKSCGSLSSFLHGCCQVWKEYATHIIYHCRLISPVVMGICNLPIRRKRYFWKTWRCLSSIINLRWKEVSCQWAYKNCRQLVFIINSNNRHFLCCLLLQCSGWRRNIV